MVNRKKIYEKVGAFLYHKEQGTKGPLTVKEAKKLLGWKEVGNGSDYLFRDVNGKKIQCTNNSKNRPLSVATMKDWKLEIARRKWKFNGESMIIDEYGLTQDCQHRLIGLVTCAQEWANGDWRDFWEEEPWIETVLVVGIDGSDETVNTIGVGRTRSLSDVFYRSHYFEDMPRGERRAAAKVAQLSVKLVWDRSVYAKGTNIYAPRRPHSESLAFFDKHASLLEAVQHIVCEDGGDQKRITQVINPGAAAGLLYMMGAIRTDFKEYKEKYEAAIDWGTWDDACDFWTNLAHGVNEFGVLRAALLQHSEGGYFHHQCRLALLVNAFNAWIEGEKITKKVLSLNIEKDEFGDDVLYDTPTLGGIDVGGEKNYEPGANDDD